MKEITIQPMKEAVLEEILALEAASFSSPWNRQHFLSELASPLSFPLIAQATDGAVEGYICPMIVLDEGSILNVAVRPESRGRGIGRLLVEAALSDLRSRGAAFVALEVRPSNRAALSLYESLGFVATGRRIAYYDNREDAVVMEYDMKRHGENGHAL
jgi:[ribosomal protein S18]-alanine N-acetyltransferase